MRRKRSEEEVALIARHEAGHLMAHLLMDATGPTEARLLKSGRYAGNVKFLVYLDCDATIPLLIAAIAGAAAEGFLIYSDESDDLDNAMELLISLWISHQDSQFRTMSEITSALTGAMLCNAGPIRTMVEIVARRLVRRGRLPRHQIRRLRSTTLFKKAKAQWSGVQAQCEQAVARYRHLPCAAIQGTR
jgi:hypothetical protein